MKSLHYRHLLLQRSCEVLFLWFNENSCIVFSFLYQFVLFGLLTKLNKSSCLSSQTSLGEFPLTAQHTLQLRCLHMYTYYIYCTCSFPFNYFQSVELTRRLKLLIRHTATAMSASCNNSSPAMQT